MRTIFLSILFVCLIAACAPAQSTETSITPLSTPIPVTPLLGKHLMIFTTPDGASIEGTQYFAGSGGTVVIFSVMGNCKRGWENMAELVARNLTTTLTYQWRGCRDSGSVDEVEIQKFVDDLRGAIAFMRAQGATKIILAGASLGGCASAKLAVESQADGLIVIASPSEISQWGFEITSADLAADIPKLFITAENDDTVSPDETRALFDLAAEPKEWQTYPGTAHGTDLFENESKEQLEGRLLEFILAIASPTP